MITLAGRVFKKDDRIEHSGLGAGFVVGWTRTAILVWYDCGAHGVYDEDWFRTGGGLLRNLSESGRG